MKKLLLLVLALVMVLGMAYPACADGEIKFTWLHHFQEAGLQKWCEDAVANFEAQYPEVDIAIEIVGADVYQQTLRMKIAAGDAPMIFDVDNNSYLQEFVAAGHIYCVDGMDYYKNVDPSLNKECEIDGVTYGSTVSQCSYNAFYNKTLFEEHGLVEPTTREEYIALCDKLLELGITPISAAFAERWCLLTEFNPYYMNYCWKDNFNFCQDHVSGATTFAGDEQLKRAYLEFVSTSKYWGDDPFGTSYDDACAAVATGKAAMICNGSWVLSVLEETNPDAEFGAFAIPTEYLEPPFIIMRPGSVQCVYNELNDEVKLEYALKFTQSLFTVESGEAFSKGATQISSVNGVDFSFNNCLKSIMDYPNKWSYGGFQRWNNEYEELFANIIMSYALDLSTDVDALTAELDNSFSTVL